MKFSVLLPVYGGDNPQLFTRAIASIEANSVKADQVVIVVDGPVCGDIEKILDQCEKKRFDIVRLRVNRGLAQALNVGLEYCRYELIARCDADDFNLEHRFAYQLKQFVDNDNLVLSGGQIIEECGETLTKLLKQVPCTHNKILSAVKFRSPFNHMTVMFKKSSVLKVGGYPDIQFREDYALWAALIANDGVVSNCTDVLVHSSGGIKMYQRRGRFSHLVFEIKLQRHLYRLKLINIFELCRNLLIRGGNMILSPYLRGLIYKTWLRKKIIEN